MSKVVSVGMSIEPSEDAPLDSTLIVLLEHSLLRVQAYLRRIGGDPLFAQRLVLAFGEGAKIDPIRKDWLEGNLAMMPTIAILSQEQMNGANGAYSGQTNRIYLSEEFLSQNSTNIEAVAGVLIEEIGHWVDQLLNEEDSAGDEGAIFAALVLGESLSDEALAQLKAENDAGIFYIDGKMVEVEQAFGITAYIQFGTLDIDRTTGISIDSSNNIYVTGWTYGNLSGAGNAGRGDVFIAKYSNSGEQIWLHQFGTVDDDLPFAGISADSSGNIYLAGTGPIVGTQRADVYLWKYSASGTQLWSRRFGTSAFDQDLRISTDASGNVLITGKTQGSFPGFTNSGGDDIFIAKYLSTGTQFWMRQFGTFSTDQAWGISADGSGNVYVSGYTQGSLPGNSNLGGRDAFLIKYSGGGSQLWVRQFGTSGNDTAFNNTTDSSGNIYVAGYTVGTLPNNSNLGGNDGFLAKYSTSGSQLWVRQFGTSGTDFAQQVITDSSGNVYLAGNTLGSFFGYSNAGLEDVFVAKYSSNGTQLWVRQFGTSASDFDSGLSVDSSGNIYLSGYTRGSLPGNSNAGNADAFIIGIHPNGRLLEKQPVNLSVSSNTGTEAGSSIITVTITTPDTVLQSQTVYLTVSGNASPTDYVLSNSTITIPTNSNVGTVTFTVFNDTLVEPTETAILTIGNLSSDLLFGATISQTITIVSNDFPRVNLSVSSNTGSEAGSTIVSVTANASDPVIGNQTVDLAITGTGITSEDYNLSNSTITFLNGQTTGAVTFTVVNDTLIEPTETATLSLTNPSSGLVLDSITSQNITLINDDFPFVNLSVSTNAATEAGTTVVTVTATASSPVLSAQTINLTVTGTGITTGDYTLSGSSINIPNGGTTGTRTFTIVNDTLVEGTETATIAISSISSGLLLGSTTSQSVTITDNDFPRVNLSVSTNTGSEAGTTIITVTANASDPVIGNQTVDLAITGTGITPSDYDLSNSTITFLNGQTTGTVTFTVINDDLIEGTETAMLTLTNPSSGLVLGSTTSQNITLADNDFPSVNLSVSSNSGSEAGTTIVTVTATASSIVLGNQTIGVEIAGTGITTEDYSLSNSIITIPNGQTTGTITFTIVDDALVEGTETATLTLTNPSSGLVLGSTISQNIILTDNDFAPPVDGNYDGIPDNQQNNVVSIQTPTNEYVTFAAPQGQPSANVQTISNPDPATAPPNVDFPLGFLDFNIPQVPLGSSTTLTLFLPQGTTANSYWKYGATPDNTTPHWYDFTFDLLTNTGATFQDINNDGQSEIILNFVDGQRGDDDLAADGQISDPGAPALFMAQPVVSIFVSSVSVSESSPYAVVEVSIAAPSSLDLQFTPSLVGGSATIGTDTAASIEVFNAGVWQTVAGAVTIPAGSSSRLLRVAIQNDLILEGPESFQVSTGAISSINPSVVLNAVGATGTITIADDGSSTNAFDADTNSATPISRSADNDTPTIAVSSITVSEASPFAVVQVSLSNASTTPIGFTPLLLSGSATTGTDTGSSLEYFDTTDSQWKNAAAGVSIAAGSTSLLLRTTISNDGDYEISESFAIATGSITSGQLTNPAGASGSVTIKDDGSSSNTFTATNTTASPTAGVADNDAPLPTGTLSVAVVQNGNETGPLATVFRLSRIGSTASPLAVSYSLGGSALAGLDYSLPAGFDPSTGKGTVSFLAGAATVDLSVASLDDGAVDGNRSLSLSLFPTTGYSLTTALATATISDNDVRAPITPSLSISGATVVETDSGTNPILNLSVGLSAPADSAITVHLRTVSASVDSASGGSDYVAIPDTTLTFLPGSTGQLVSIELIGDNSIEKTESFLVELFNATGASLPNGPATVQIVDNDSSKYITINHSASTTAQAFSGGSVDDVLIGGSADDVINGDPVGPAGGVDRITGNGGGDTLTGGPNADLFLYPFFSDSTLLNLDRIRDFTPSGSNPDRIAVNASALPTALWNIGKIIPSVTAFATSPSLGHAAALAFADKDIITAGLQSLGAHEAVLFAYETTPGNRRSQKWFLSVNDATPDFSSSDDLLIDVTGITASFPSGLLAVNNLFSHL